MDHNASSEQQMSPPTLAVAVSISAKDHLVEADQLFLESEKLSQYIVYLRVRIVLKLYDIITRKKIMLVQFFDICFGSSTSQ